LNSHRNKNLTGRNPTIPTNSEKDGNYPGLLLEKTVIDSRGRIVIPSSIRKRMSMHPGDTIYLIVNDREFRLITQNRIIQIFREELPGEDD
jgi:AbrB family looped-hinge helix DNA binding protein